MTKIEKTGPLVRKDIEAGLTQIGVTPGQMVEVHSSLSSLGWVEGGAATVVDALMGIIGEEGSIVMSAYPVSKPLPLTVAEKALGILAKVRTYAEDYHGPTGMGAIADEFCRRPGAILGPTWHRVCAWGCNARQLSQGYHVLLEMGGWVLLMGVDITRCSCMHQAEKVPLPPDIEQRFELPDVIRRKYPDDIHLAYRHSPEDAWLKIQQEAEELGVINIGQIGRATCRFFRARTVVGLYEEARRTDPWSLFGVAKPLSTHMGRP